MLLKGKIEAGYSVQTAVHIRNAISAVFNHAKLKRAFHGDNPVEGVRLPEMERKEKHSLTFEQGRALLEVLSYPVREMALVSMTTSLNVAEMCALRWKRVNLTSEPTTVDGELVPPFSLAVRENYYDGKFGSVKATSRRRNVPLSNSVIATLIGIRTVRNSSNPTILYLRVGTGRRWIKATC